MNRQTLRLLPFWARALCFGASLALASLYVGAEPDNTRTVTYPGFPRDSYLIAVLEQALSYSKQTTYQVSALGADLPKERSFALLGEENGLDVVMGTCTKDRAKMGRPVHFPLFRGGNGMRVALVHEQRADILREVRRIEDLDRLVVGQFHSWSDTKILRSNGLRVFGGSDVQGLYQMLHKQRIDYFLRSVLEIEQDLSRQMPLDLRIDSHLLVQYPSAYYFFVDQGDDELADALLSGLQQSLADGSFLRLFNSSFADRLERLQLGHRHLIELSNPLLCEGVPLKNQALWLKADTATISE
ncbi:hypothetical protein [Lacimicrobium sp. SS2-24]|uniref:hypothetical protein n=1 Tax=Lacimicrobium sp. SS2-24 TaxID=2005569 RepID=UPI000B4AFB08|nr:hypothetical protein [Lacimicrobium sp. SS2-24]